MNAVTYGPANEMTSINRYGYSEGRTYNSLLQLTRQRAYLYPGYAFDTQYTYTAGANNGRITQSVDNVSGERVTYTYDALNRLIHAETAGPQWGESYTFDGFGNLTAKNATKGSATNWTQSYFVSNNQPVGYGFDGSGNPTGPVYDVENRMTAYSTTSYWYDPSGKRVMQGYPDGNGGTYYWIYFYGVDGRRLEEMRCDVTPGNPSPTTVCNSGTGNVYFSGRMVAANGVPVVTDRLGSVRTGLGAAETSYLPYGEEEGSQTTADGIEKFGTYFRDSTSLHQDYADQRYYNPWFGRFNTPDPRRGVDPKDPASWNKYAYVGGDPVNHYDPRRLDSCDPGATCVTVTDTPDPLIWIPAPTPNDPDGGMLGGYFTTSQVQGAIGDALQLALAAANLGSTAQGGIVRGSTNFGMAASALVGEAEGIAGSFLSPRSAPCEADLTAVGVNDAQVAKAAANVNIVDGLTSMDNYAQAIYGNSPASGAAAFAYGSVIMAQYMSINSGVAAVSSAPGNNIYINASWINGMTVGQQQGLLLHELLHGITGKSDDVIQGALGLPTGVPSQNIGDKLQRDCFR